MKPRRRSYSLHRVDMGSATPNNTNETSPLSARAHDPSFPVVPVILPEARSIAPFNFLRLVTWIDFSRVAKVSEAPEELEHLVTSIQAGGPAAARNVRSRGSAPTVGSTHFGRRSVVFFFGRGSEEDPESPIGQLVRKVREHPFVMVVGRSGSGKSSLVYAGLVPALRRARDKVLGCLDLADRDRNRCGHWPPPSIRRRTDEGQRQVRREKSARKQSN